MVSLVGAGPGDPGLLTVRGRAVIERADVVLYDLLAHPTLLEAVDVPGQERIHVGKLAGAGLSAQGAINALMVRRALAGQRVCRLKGGDPLVFGRGGEELEACAAAGVAFEVVPGVSSIAAAPAFAGIPLTHRGLSCGFTVVTGHERDDVTDGRVDWAHHARSRDTLVVLMGVGTVERWTGALLAGGRDPATPVAFVRWATLPAQRTLVTTLGAAAADVAAAGLSSPAVAVVGPVVGLRDRLAWFDRQPLHGQVIGLTRDTPADAEIFEPLHGLGAGLVWLPLTRKQPTNKVGVLSDRLRTGGFTDVVLTSANGVRGLRDALEAAGLDTRAFAGVRTWAVGPATARTMREVLSLGADLVAEPATGDGVVALAATVGVTGRRFLFPAAVDARRAVPEGLTALGATVEEVAIYETVPEPSAATRLVSAVEAGLTLITVSSPSAVRALADAMDGAGIARDAFPLAAIGPTTRDAAVQQGFRVTVMPPRYTLPDLVEAIVAAARSGVV
ncbi:MAG: uroporphyrinogen-III C-methyltransferase [Deltaproteobacteria bacterium HGW-Deltaproteobacteria-14]|jgi:uroporphyrinogen III methyltransferase/synthase|nr:MAG: uroporphyrinogen-III C-methyltransferase [Deltaproteobacteria bacterium HGW-Deltaproteobacteria-14]